jgi:hypothetical protein
MKTHSSQLNSFVQTILRSKDDALNARGQVIAEKERLIENLLVIQRASLRDIARKLEVVFDLGIGDKTRKVLAAALGLPTFHKVIAGARVGNEPVGNEPVGNEPVGNEPVGKDTVGERHRRERHCRNGS